MQNGRIRITSQDSVVEVKSIGPIEIHESIAGETAQRVVAKQVQVVLYQHEISRPVAAVDAPRGTGQQEPLAAKRSGQTHRKSRLKGAEPLIAMKAPDKEEDFPGSGLHGDQSTTVAGDLAGGETWPVGVLESAVRLTDLRGATPAGAEYDGQVEIFGLRRAAHFIHQAVARAADIKGPGFCGHGLAIHAA